MMAMHQNAVLSVCHRTFYVPLTHEQVYIFFIPTNILKIQTFHEFESLCQNGFMNYLQNNLFCSCLMNEAHRVADSNPGRSRQKIILRV